MTEQLTTQNATITTAAIQVQALTIGRKQVTQSVFRQLREEPLIADDGTLNGEPWGSVNYHPDRCGDDRREHWHIVWQQGAELRRARVDTELPPTAWGCKDGDAFLSAHAREVFEDRGRYFGARLPAFDNGLTVTLRSEASFPVLMQFDGSLMGAACAWEEWRSAVKTLEKNPHAFAGTESWRRKQLAEAVESLSCQPPEPAEVDRLYAAYREKLTAEVDRRDRQRQVRVGLAQLPQLFIAV